MKKIVYMGCILFFLLFTVPVSALELDINSQNAILYHLDEGTVLYEKNPDEVISIASLTKIMTALIVIEKAETIEEKVVLTYEDFRGLAAANASVAGFYVGEEVTLRDLLYGLMFPSGAEAAQALTRYFGGKEKFVDLMNKKAQELGLKNTQFKNETGLDEDGHYSTVREVALLLEYALQNETFQSIFETKEYLTSNKRLSFQSTVQKFLNRTGLSMDYLLGGKTGTTENAGLCLASLASSNGSTYLLVTARAENDWVNPRHLYDAKTIYDYFIEHFEMKMVLEEKDQILELPTKFAKEDSVCFYAPQEIQKYVSKEFQKEDLHIKYEGMEEVTPWIKKGSVLGTLKISYLEEELLNYEIVLQENLSFDVLKFYQVYQKEVLSVFLVFLFCVILIILRKRSKKNERRKNSRTNKKNQKRK